MYSEDSQNAVFDPTEAKRLLLPIGNWISHPPTTPPESCSIARYLPGSGTAS